MIDATEFYISLPEIVASLDEVAPEIRGHYVESGGAFALSQAARDEIAACNRAMDEQVAADNAKLAELDATAAAKQAVISDLCISGALDDALAAHGAQPRLRNGARAFLKSTWKFQVDDDERVVVVGPGGELAVGDAVQRWLASDAGSAFAAAPPPEQRGVFARLLAR
jgi:hypothetical protein